MGLQKAFFGCDCGDLSHEAVYEGLYDPEYRWNGFAMPMFPMREVVRLKAYLEEAGDDINSIVIHSPTMVELVFEDGDEKDSDMMEGVLVNGEYYFNFGNQGWTWDDYTELEVMEARAKAQELMKYATVPIQELIQRLQDEFKAGARTVSLTKGSLIIPHNGNKVILTNEAQM